MSHTELSLYGAKDVINTSEISLFHFRISKHDIFRENFGETKLTKGNIEHALRQLFGFPKVMQENLKEALDELLRRERVLDQLKQFTDNTGHLTSMRMLDSATICLFKKLFLVENGRNLFVSTRGPLFRLVFKFRLNRKLYFYWLRQHRSGNRSGNSHLKTILSQTWWDMFLLKRQVKGVYRKNMPD